MEYFMAKIVEDVIVIKFSKIVKDSEADVSGIAGHDIQQALEQVAQELVGDAVVVEVVRA
jgi:histone H3/H4